jgi:hypothetical protein
MKQVLIGIGCAVLMGGVVIAQSNSASSPPSANASAQQSPQQTSQPQMPAAQGTPAVPPNSRAGAGTSQAGPVTRIAPGSVIPVSLTKTVDAKKAKVGDEVVAKVTQDMKSNSGQVIVAKDTKMMGRVTEAQARTKEQKESEVAIAFDRAVMKDGTSMSMPMSIQAVIGPQNNSPQANQNNTAGAAEPPSPTGGGTGGNHAGMGGSSPSPSPSSTPDMPSSGTPQNTASHSPITASTQGVIGISNLTLASTAPNASQGSLLTSDKNNVKIESGTLLLLRVNQ